MASPRGLAALTIWAPRKATDTINLTGGRLGNPRRQIRPLSAVRRSGVDFRARHIIGSPAPVEPPSNSKLRSRER